MGIGQALGKATDCTVDLPCSDLFPNWSNRQVTEKTLPLIHFAAEFPISPVSPQYTFPSVNLMVFDVLQSKLPEISDERCIYKKSWKWRGSVQPYSQTCIKAPLTC